VGVPLGWSVAPQVFKNSIRLSDVGPGESRRPSTHLETYLEPRLNHADALKQIREFASVVGEKDKLFAKIGGWPAVQITRIEPRELRGEGPQPKDPKILLIKTYIAVDDCLVVAVAALPSDASAALVKQCLAISSSLEFEHAGDPSKVQEEIKKLQEPAQIESTPGATKPEDARRETPQLQSAAGQAEYVRNNIRINANGRGELEVAVLPDASDGNTHVVVALQGSRWVASHDGGTTFPDSGHINFGDGDPSIAVGRSGDFYMAGIDSGCGATYQGITYPPGPAPYGYDCTGIARSTHAWGAAGSFQFQTNGVNPPVLCIAEGDPQPANHCFPDQEHIAADRVNAGTSGGDQVYATWRIFISDVESGAGLVCTQDSAINWTQPSLAPLGPNSAFPRITVGQDGFVYIAAYGAGFYRLWKFTSCANGRSVVAGFPVNVVARKPYTCPFAGHDRCDQNPSSQTVAVDDTNPNHVYYAYVQDAAAANSDSNVFVRHSTDGGLTWPVDQVVQANPAVNARRIMPWMSTSEGNAVVTWYEQSAPVPSDSTHFFSARVSINNSGNLIVSQGFRVSEVSDNWCDSGWSCGTRSSNAAEACPQQPQLAGYCGDNIDTTPDSHIRCDFSDEAATPGRYCPQAPTSPSGNNEICLGGNGCPKYGDYNGNASAGGKLFAAWPSADSPPGVPPPNTATNTGVLFDVVDLNVADPIGVWVAFNYSGIENGVFDQPFNTVAEGVAATRNGGSTIIKSGSTSETLAISKPVTLRSWNGTVTIGQ
jgi:hypothetical protein